MVIYYDKFYCPQCGLPLKDDRSGHKSESKAWGMFECEYPQPKFSDSELKPVTGLEKASIDLKSLVNDRNDLNKSIKILRQYIGENNG